MSINMKDKVDSEFEKIYEVIHRWLYEQKSKVWFLILFIISGLA